MAGTRQIRQDAHRRQATYRKDTVREGAYVSGNVVRKLDITTAIEEAPKKRLSHTARKNREKARHMNLGYVVFLMAALILSGFVLIGYIGLQSELTASVKRISGLESQLNKLRMDNDEEYSRVQSSVDLEEIKRIAIEELGMTYAEEGQVVEYSPEGSDYVRQITDIPK